MHRAEWSVVVTLAHPSPPKRSAQGLHGTLMPVCIPLYVRIPSGETWSAHMLHMRIQPSPATTPVRMSGHSVAWVVCYIYTTVPHLHYSTCGLSRRGGGARCVPEKELHAGIPCTGVRLHVCRMAIIASGVVLPAD